MGGILDSCDVYDPHLQSWAEGSIKPLTRPRWGHGCVALGGKIYVVGGCSLQVGHNVIRDESNMETMSRCDMYDPSTNEWTSCCSMHTRRAGARVVALQDRYIVVIGGCD